MAGETEGGIEKPEAKKRSTEMFMKKLARLLIRGSVILAAMQPRKSSGSMRLLIVDDEENIRKTTAVVLEAMGHETVGAESAATALKQLEKRRIRHSRSSI